MSYTLSCAVVASVFLTICYAELTCPQCDGICEDAGFLSCEGCMCQMTCQDFACGPGLVCLMKEVDCIAEPCPNLPNCVSSSSLCKGKKPVLDKSLSPVPCGSNCPDSHDCVEGICCEHDTVANTITPEFSLNSLGIPIDILSKTPSPCLPCPYTPCSVTPCLKHPDAICKTDRCSCLHWYEDVMGNVLDCSGFELPIDPNQGQTQTTALETQKEDEGTNDAMKYGIIAAGAVVVAVLLMFGIYKIVENKKKRPEKPQYCSDDVEVQLFPLNKVSKVNGENNNQDKKPEITSTNRTNDSTSCDCEKISLKEKCEDS